MLVDLRGLTQRGNNNVLFIVRLSVSGNESEIALKSNFAIAGTVRCFLNRRRHRLLQHRLSWSCSPPYSVSNGIRTFRLTTIGHPSATPTVAALAACLPVWLSACLPTCLSACLPVCLR